MRESRSSGNRRSRASTILAALALMTAAPAGAQSEYRNTEAGRPLRVEDATATERHGVDLDLLPLRLERVLGGAYRWQVEPRASYGLLPRTELGVRVPVVYREQDTRPRGGLLGVGVGAMHGFTIETPRVPALALAGDVLLPTGGKSSGRLTYALKGLATRTLSFARLHVNATYGRVGVRIPAPIPLTDSAAGCPAGTVPSSGPGGGCVPSTPVDPPCRHALEREDEAPDAGAGALAAAAIPPASRSESHVYWLVGIAADRALALRSILLMGDVYAERVEGLRQRATLTAEFGARGQITPRVVVDAGIGGRFTGLSPSWFFTLGSTYSFAVQLGRPAAP